MNNNWGYRAADFCYKSPSVIVRKLIECVSKNGNLLLNVGPDAYGNIPEQSLEILNQIGKWMRLNGSSIYNCGKSDLPKPEWGRYTQNGSKLYAHIMEESIGAINLNGLNGKIKKARLLKDGSEILLLKPWNTAEYPDDAFINFVTPEHSTFPHPDDTATVVELELM